MAATASEIEDFLSGPLVKWLSTCLKKPETLQVYESFFDGAPISEVLLLIDPEPSQPVPSISNLGLSIIAARIKIFHCIVRNIKSVYEEELGQVVVSVPDCVVLGRTPASQAALEQLKLLILLLLGCAVQGPTKEVFIGRIKELSVEDQHDIVECIKRVTDDQSIVLTQDWPDQAPQRLYSHVRTLTIERDKLVQQWVTDLGQESPMLENTQKSGSQEVESNHLAVELADWKARMRRQRQELEEKSEILVECKEELEHCKSMLAKLKTENADLATLARQAHAYRDEVDAMRERSDRADRLEAEAQRYRDRLADAEFYRARVEELREDGRVLIETRDMLEAQLAAARRRGDRADRLDAELMAERQKLDDAKAERDAAKQRIQELLDENLQLQQLAKSALQANNVPLEDSGGEEEEPDSGDNSLSEQLTTNAQARALRLELENRRLAAAVEALSDSDATKAVELERERERGEQLGRQVVELEGLLGEAGREGRKMQEAVDAQKAILDRQNAELHQQRSRLNELEDNIEVVTKEKQRVQALCDAAKKRAEDSEKSLGDVGEQLSALQSQADRVGELERAAVEMAEKVGGLEKENAGLAREVGKLKAALEAKDVAADETAEQTAKLERDLHRLTAANVTLSAHLERLQAAEARSHELASQASVDAETIAALRRALVDEKVAGERARAGMGGTGLPEGDVEEITALRAANDALREENATLKVDVSTLGSQVGALQAQQTALQLANGQLVVEKEELVKKQQIQSSQHDTLLLDQVTLRTLHEQLSLEYEQAKQEQETLRKISRDLRSETRTLREERSALEARLSVAEAEKDALRGDAKSLANLRAEHSRLKDDFRNLFTASERLKQEYRAVQEELKGLRTESRNLRLGRTEMQGELNLRSDRVASFQLENARLQQKCDMLFEMNHSLDSDRRALMDHVSQLLSQYHSLLTHSLEDKQHYHTEEKQYTDKVNNLCRQKEKLEEKIMEHYRKLDNASAKKKGFGATLVRRVRKAGSDIINRVPSRNRRSWHEDAARMTQSQIILLNDGSGESNGNASDNSDGGKGEPFRRGVSGGGGSLHGHRPRDEVALRRSSQKETASQRNSLADDNHQTAPPEPNPAALSLGSVGTRRTVYLPEEDPTPIAAALPPAGSPATPAPANPPMLVYNKISTVIGELPAPPDSGGVPPTPSGEDPNKGGRSAKETAVWYEYGCV